MDVDSDLFLGSCPSDYMLNQRHNSIELAKYALWCSPKAQWIRGVTIRDYGSSERDVQVMIDIFPFPIVYRSAIANPCTLKGTYAGARVDKP